MRSTHDPDDDAQQGPEHTDARPRADSSSVAKCSDADLEQTEAQSPGKMLQISSRQQTSLRESERNESRKASPDLRQRPPTARYIRIQQKDCAQQQVERKPYSADGAYRNAKFRSVGDARVQCKERENHEHKSREVACESDKDFSVRARRQKETRGSRTSQRSPTYRRITP